MILENPFFWAFMATCAIVGGNAIQGSPAFGSTIGVLLTPAWAAVFWLHALIEEEALQREYGTSYREYMARVRCRLIPGIPV